MSSTGFGGDRLGQQAGDAGAIEEFDAVHAEAVSQFGVELRPQQLQWWLAGSCTDEPSRRDGDCELSPSPGTRLLEASKTHGSCGSALEAMPLVCLARRTLSQEVAHECMPSLLRFGLCFHPLA
jgi:hypothetical protein